MCSNFLETKCIENKCLQMNFRNPRETSHWTGPRIAFVPEGRLLWYRDGFFLLWVVWGGVTEYSHVDNLKLTISS